jgi:hypothetical protein
VVSPAELIKKASNPLASTEDRVNYVAHDFGKVSVQWGLPPVRFHGLSRVVAYRTTPETKMFGCLTGKAVFGSSVNWFGAVEIDILEKSISSAAIEVLNLTGVAFPILISDETTSNTSLAAGAAARLVATPPLRASRTPGLTTYTWEVDKLIINHGARDTV